MSKKRTFMLPIVGAAASAFLLHGCERNYPRQVCVDGAGARVDDGDCLQPGGRYHWYYYSSGGGGVPGLGGHVSGGGYARVYGQTYYAAPAEGVTRGGFGGFGGEGEGGAGE
jgi:hypothetical protein